MASGDRKHPYQQHTATQPQHSRLYALVPPAFVIVLVLVASYLF